jgi:CDP-glycerol glycerophosphotransferase
MPRISVVVPIHDVESYLATCLQSLARQSFTDLEVLMVDDGSTDRSPGIAARFAERDRRFRLLRQANAGLGAARNTGIEAATGELLAFADSDDVVPPRAYERLLDSLDHTGSDFASGNVLRLDRQGTTQAQFLARTFSCTRTGAHVTRCRPLLADRTAWNKLWRRSFWDAQGLRFPEGVVHEDIPVTLPAHLAARSVDVLASPVYHWRLREDGAPSITQRRLEHRVLRDRLAAIRHVRRHFAERGTARLCRWYDASLLADDLRLHLDLLHEADDAYRATFMSAAGELLADAPARICDGLSAIDRVKWRLVALGRLDELVEVLRFQRGPRRDGPPVRRRLRYYGRYPHRDDLPRATYRLGRRDEDLALRAHLDDLRRDGSRLRLRGHAYIAGLGAPAAGAQRTALAAVRPGRLRPVRSPLAGLRLPTAPARRTDLPASGVDIAWSGFEATLDPEALRVRGAWVDGTWDIHAVTRHGMLRRRRARFVLDSAALLGAIDLPVAGDAHVRARVTPDGAVRIDVRTRWARLCELTRIGAELELRGEGCVDPGADWTIVLERRSDGERLSGPARLERDGTRRRFLARASLLALAGAPPSLEATAAGTGALHEMWELQLVGGGRRYPLSVPQELAGAAWPAGGAEVSMVRTRSGDAALVVCAPATALAAGAPPPAFAGEAAFDLPLAARA